MLVFVGRLCPEFVRVFNQVMVLLVDVRKSSVGNCPSITVWSSQVCVFSRKCFIPIDFLHLNRITIAYKPHFGCFIFTAALPQQMLLVVARNDMATSFFW